MSDADRARRSQGVVFIGGPMDGQHHRVDYVTNTFSVSSLSVDKDARPGQAIFTLEVYKALEVADGFDAATLHWVYVHDSIRYPLAHLLRSYQGAQAAPRG